MTTTTQTQTIVRPSRFKDVPRTLRGAGSNYIFKDIGGKKIDQQTRLQLLTSFLDSKLKGERVVLPDELLYDDIGLKIWSDIIYLPEYYQTHDETAILKLFGKEIAAYVPNRASLIDLGAGDTRKVSHLIGALEKTNKKPAYYALDISQVSLNNNLTTLSHKHPQVQCTGLWGTFVDGTKWIASLKSPRLFLSLGSVLCNDAWDTALHYLCCWAKVLRPSDLFLIGMDGHSESWHDDKVWRSYHQHQAAGAHISSSNSHTNSADGHGSAINDHFSRFWRNGFDHANRLVGEPWFQEADWLVSGVIEHEPVTSHRFIFRAKRDIALGSSGVTFRKGEEIDWFDAHKYGERDVRTLCALAGLEVLRVWKAPQSEMRSYLVKKNTENTTYNTSHTRRCKSASYVYNSH